MNALETGVQECVDNRCATEAICPEICTGATRWTPKKHAPTVAYGTAWSEQHTATTFDTAWSMHGSSDTAITLVAASNFPRAADIRTAILESPTGSDFTDRTPSLLTTFGADVRYEQAGAVRVTPSGTFILTNGVTHDYAYFARLYRLAAAGSGATPIGEALFAGQKSAAALWSRGDELWAGGAAAGKPFLAHVTDGDATAVAFPPERLGSVRDIAGSADAIWAVSDGAIFEVKGANATPIALPPGFRTDEAGAGSAALMRTAAFANGRLNVLVGSDPIRPTLWTRSGDTWSYVCPPEDQLTKLTTLTDGALLVGGAERSYVFDGTQWRALPPHSGVLASAHGSREALTIGTAELGGQGHVLHLVR